MSESVVRESAPPAMAPSTPKTGRIEWLLIVAILAVIGTGVRAIYFTPMDSLQGAVQKIFYVHVPSAFVALYMAFALVALMSALFLWLHDLRFDRVAESSAEVGVIFTTAVLCTGPIWAKAAWGTWWTWDARLTSTLFLWFMYVGYLVMRGAMQDRMMRARYSAVLGLLGALLIPFIHLSVYLFRTMHPRPIVLKPSAPSLPPDMLQTFLLALCSFALLFVALLRIRYRMAVARDALLEEND
ncbi:MAG TPA: cytochrome c biogenesis protein CcsA [Gemmatimonadaceae bacterium]|nr:cytochrome c biogenesis protein CcsA [Gemmatimonadaceae bacterium]